MNDLETLIADLAPPAELQLRPYQDMRGMLTSAHKASTYALAGNARLTLQSKKTGARFTYSIRKIEDADPGRWFVGVLTGPNNDSDYSYMGLIDSRIGGFLFKRTAKSKIGADAPSFKAFEYFAQKVLNGSAIPDALEIYHEGRCGKCNRRLTVPESVERGLGPECAGLR